MRIEGTEIIMGSRILLGDPTHVCVVVRDVEKTANAYADLFGIGPFQVRVIETPSERALVQGQHERYVVKFAYAKTATIVIELAETAEGRTAYKEFLDAHGEGIHHIGFKAPPPLDRELERWRKQGISSLQVNYRDDTRYGWAYMDTRATVGCILEIVCDPSLGWWESLGLAHDLGGPLGKV